MDLMLIFERFERRQVLRLSNCTYICVIKKEYERNEYFLNFIHIRKNSIHELHVPRKFFTTTSNSSQLRTDIYKFSE